MSVLSAGALLLLTLLAGIAVVLRVAQRRRRGRIVQYAPPARIGLLAAGVLTHTENRAAAAELVNLAVRRRVRFLTPDAGSAQLRMELLDGPPLSAEQGALLAAVFGAPRTIRRRAHPVRTIRRDATVSSAVRGVIASVIAALRAGGLVLVDAGWPALLLRCSAVAALCAYAVAVLGAANLWAPNLWAPNLWAPNLWLSLALGTVAIGLAAVAFLVPPARVRRFSASSFDVRDHLAGLHDYITLAEADRLRFLQSPSGALTRRIDTPDGRVEALVLNERLLPYAVLFGHEREWAKLLETEHRALVASGALDAVDGLHLLALVGDLGADLPLAELLAGLRGLDVDLSLLAGIELPEIDLGALGLDL